jgi:hypothetical protein
VRCWDPRRDREKHSAAVARRALAAGNMARPEGAFHRWMRDRRKGDKERYNVSG